MRLPDCMMPDGADPCCGAKEMIDQIERLTAELQKAKSAINGALEYSGGRWCEWGSRAEAVRDILEAAITDKQ